jgi:hypothetical protein
LAAHDTRRRRDAQSGSTRERDATDAQPEKRSGKGANSRLLLLEWYSSLNGLPSHETMPEEMSKRSLERCFERCRRDVPASFFVWRREAESSFSPDVLNVRY